MKVVEPNKDERLYNDILKNLHILKDAIDTQMLTVDERVKMCVNLRRDIMKLFSKA